MAMLALSFAGSAIGASVFGAGVVAFGLTGSTIGGMIGSAVGGLLGGGGKDVNIDQFGPRISDLQVQVSTYGQPIAKVYGRVPLTGNLIWSSDIIETTHTSSQSSGGGKGGGGESTVTTTTYSYKAHMAVGICEGPITGIRRIWANGKLLYDAGTAGADANTIYASNEAAESIKFYLGSATQVVNSLIESYVGAGNTPAYRNLAYVVFDGLQLADFGNRIPNFEFEVLSSSTVVEMTRLSTYANLGIDQFKDNNATFDIVKASFVNAGFHVSAFTYTRKTVGIDGTIYSSYTTAQSASFPAGGTGIIGGTWLGLYVRAIVYDGNRVFSDLIADPLAAIAPSSSDAFIPPDTSLIGAFKFGSFGVLLTTVAGSYILNQVNFTAAGLPAHMSNGITATLPVVSTYRYCVEGMTIWMADTGNFYLYKYDAQTLTLQATYGPFSGTATFNAHPIRVHGDRIIIGGGSNVSYNSTKLFRLNPDFTMTLLLTSNSIETTYGSTTLWPGDRGIVVGGYNNITFDGVVSPNAVTLSTIVSDLCARAGLAAGEIDVTALTDSVTGYVVGKRMALSAALLPLMHTYFFDVVESSGKIKFLKRSGSSVVTFASADLAARVAGEEVADLVTHTRRHDLELPVEVSVLFLNDGSGYEQGAQYARRLTSQVESRRTIELPVVLTDTQAKRTADTIMFDAWASRDTFTWRTGRKYAKYEPGDIVTLPLSATEALAVRITKRDDGANGVISWDAAAIGDSTIYTQAATTQSAVAPDETFSVPGPTNLELMDIPLLRDNDDAYGFYTVASGYLVDWRGAALFRSADGGSSYVSLQNGTMLAEASIGHAENVLESVTLFDQFDEKNTLSVFMVEGTLASVTREEVINGANAALVGNELIQFRTATLVNTRQYTLSGLLRARLGTDWAVGTHAINDRFVMLDSLTLRFIAQSSADVGVSRLYKAVSLGNTLSDAAAEALTYAGVNLECLSPVHVGGGRVANDVIINWRRRTRLNAVWRNYVDAALGETAESYEVDVMNGAAVVRTIAVSTNTATYTSAQQTTDFGSPQASVVFRVYQLSSKVGRGYVRQATI